MEEFVGVAADVGAVVGEPRPDERGAHDPSMAGDHHEPAGVAGGDVVEGGLGPVEKPDPGLTPRGHRPDGIVGRLHLAV